MKRKLMVILGLLVIASMLLSACAAPPAAAAKTWTPVVEGSEKAAPKTVERLIVPYKGTFDPVPFTPPAKKEGLYTPKVEPVPAPPKVRSITPPAVPAPPTRDTEENECFSKEFIVAADRRQGSPKKTGGRRPLTPHPIRHPRRSSCAYDHPHRRGGRRHSRCGAVAVQC